MRSCVPAFALTLLLPSSCADPALAAAEDSLHRFHRALAQGDRGATRDSVTRGSRPYVRALPKLADASEPLRVVARRRENARVYLDVRDENPGAAVREGTYVVAKEHGEWRVDLILTAGANSHEEALPGPPTRIVPTDLHGEALLEAKRQMAENARRRRP